MSKEGLGFATPCDAATMSFGWFFRLLALRSSQLFQVPPVSYPLNPLISPKLQLIPGHPSRMITLETSRHSGPLRSFDNANYSAAMGLLIRLHDCFIFTWDIKAPVKWQFTCSGSFKFIHSGSPQKQPSNILHGLFPFYFPFLKVYKVYSQVSVKKSHRITSRFDTHMYLSFRWKTNLANVFLCDCKLVVLIKYKSDLFLLAVKLLDVTRKYSHDLAGWKQLGFQPSEHQRWKMSDRWWREKSGRTGHVEISRRIVRKLNGRKGWI